MRNLLQGNMSGSHSPACAMQPGWDAAERKAYLLAALLLPLRLARVPLKKGKTQPLASSLILNALKWGNQDAKAVEALHEHSQALLEAYPLVQACGFLLRPALPQPLLLSMLI